MTFHKLQIVLAIKQEVNFNIIQLSQFTVVAFLRNVTNQNSGILASKTK